jgi:hypothetical protein
MREAVQSGILDLPDVTLACVDTRDTEQAADALQVCSMHISYGRKLLFGCHRPRSLPRDVEFVPIAKLDIGSYSEFIVRDLVGFVETSHCLVVQADGMVCNPCCWDPAFLTYDYIGAPWPDSEAWIGLQPEWKQAVYRRQIARGRGRVGNGGFSLRSRKLLECCAEHDAPVDVEEDYYICMRELDHFLAEGMVFADVQTAARFSLENPVADCAYDLRSCFGFHGIRPETETLRDVLMREARASEPVRARMARHIWRLIDKSAAVRGNFRRC